MIADWLEQNGYPISSQVLKTEMSGNYMESAEKHVENGEKIDNLLRSQLKIDIRDGTGDDFERKSIKSIGAGRPFAKINMVDKQRAPLKITPLSDEEFRKTMRKRMEMERERVSCVK